jgi:O-antigen ligase
MYKNVTFSAAKLFFILSLFVVPFSTALTNIFVGLLFIAFLLAALADTGLLLPFKLRPSVLALILLGMLLIGWSWSIAPQDEVFHALGKYRKLLLLPIGIALAWRDDRLPRKAFIAFMAGTAALTLSCYLVYFNLMPHETFGWWRVGTEANAFAFKSYITIGILLGFAGMACLAYFVYAESNRSRLLAVLAGFYFLIPVVFLIQGRTGYVVALCGLIGLCTLRFWQQWRRLCVGMVAIAVLAFGVYSTSGNLRMRTMGLESEVEHYSSTQELNSSGIRLTFYRAGLQMFLQHPLFGTGTGSFAEGFAPTALRLAPVGDPFRTERSQPHSEVVLMGVQLGMLGLLLYFGLLASLAVVVRRHKSYQAEVLFLLCISFAVPALFNSLLWDFTEGYWFTLLAGCLYAAACKPGTKNMFNERISA